MKLNQLTEEDIKFIKNLSHEIKTQDTRATAQPYGLTITQEKIVRKDEGCGSELACEWNGEMYAEYEWPQFLQDIEEYYDRDEYIGTLLEKVLSLIQDMKGFQELRDTNEAEYIEADVYEVDIEQVVDPMKFNFFLTEKAAYEYIENDKHNLRNPKTFGVYLKKNDEMLKLLEVIHKIADSL